MGRNGISYICAVARPSLASLRQPKGQGIANAHFSPIPPTELLTILADEMVDDVGMTLWMNGDNNMRHIPHSMLPLGEDRERQ